MGDIRESPALKIIELLQAAGSEVSYHDPHVPALSGLGLQSTDLDSQLAEADVVCIVTAHPDLDYQAVVGDSAPVVDFRGVTRKLGADNVILIGRGAGATQGRGAS